jgi:hypothetical protein
LVFAVRSGEAVTVKGGKTGVNPVVTAVSLTSDATGAVIDTRPPGPPQQLDDESRVKLQLHDPGGHLNGVPLEGGAIVRMPSPDAEQDAAGLAVGQSRYVVGEGVTTPLGKMIAAREIGPAKIKLIKVDESRFERWKHDFFDFGDAPTPADAPPLAAAAPAPIATKNAVARPAPAQSASQQCDVRFGRAARRRLLPPVKRWLRRRPLERLLGLAPISASFVERQHVLAGASCVRPRGVD